VESAAAPAQLNRALEEEELDVAFLYVPLLRKGIRVERIASDRLVMVTADKTLDWRDNFVRINWSEAAKLELNARLGELPAPGFELALGVLSLNWLVATGGSGFVPERLARPLI
jgi:DNA-binding transcriptional LysR family regulator